MCFSYGLTVNKVGFVCYKLFGHLLRALTVSFSEELHSLVHHISAGFLLLDAELLVLVWLLYLIGHLAVAIEVKWLSGVVFGGVCSESV